MQTNTLPKLFRHFGQPLLKNQTRSLSLDKRFQAIDQDMFLSRPNVFKKLPRSPSLTKLDRIRLSCFSTSPTEKVQLNNGNLSKKMIGQDVLRQSPSKLFTRRAEEETVEVEGVGWAGQPIVKRLHTIIPEANGDISDIAKVTKRSKVITEVSSNLGFQIRNFGRSHDIIAAINENARTGVMKIQEMGEMPNSNAIGKRLLHTKKDTVYLNILNSGVFFRNPPKIKRKKKTVVVRPKKAGTKKKTTKRKLHKKKTTLYPNQDNRMNPSLLMNRRFSTMPLLKSVNQYVKRQFQTYSVLGAAKKDKSKRASGTSTQYDDDCVCPEILYSTGKRKFTKICGTPEEAEQVKKKSSWKQQMCPVEPKQQYPRERTLVCLSEAQKQKKRVIEPPPCPPPEEKVLPRVIICEPNIIDEIVKEREKEKECPVEDVKPRKRTKVCKPVIIFASEVSGVIEGEAAVCTSTKVKKVVSRHTKICEDSSTESNN